MAGSQDPAVCVLDAVKANNCSSLGQNICSWRRTSANNVKQLAAAGRRIEIRRPVVIPVVMEV